MRTTGIAAWLAIAVAPVVVSGQTSSTTRCDAIQYRFVNQGTPNTVPRRHSIQDGRSYALSDSIVVDGRDVAEIQVFAHAVGTDTTWDVSARLTPAGAGSMAAATGSNRGRTLVALFGDTILAQGVIESQLGPRVPVRLGVTHLEAESLAARVRRASGSNCRRD